MGNKEINSQCNSESASSGLLDLSFIDGYYGLKIVHSVHENCAYELAGTYKKIECEKLYYKPSEDRWWIYKKKV